MEKIKGGLSAGVQIGFGSLIVGRERDTQNFNAVRENSISHKNYNVISTTFTRS
jgi:hypothetical protein